MAGSGLRSARSFERRPAGHLAEGDRGRASARGRAASADEAPKERHRRTPRELGPHRLTGPLRLTPARRGRLGHLAKIIKGACQISQAKADLLLVTHLRQDLGDSAGFRLIWHEELAESLGILEWQDM